MRQTVNVPQEVIDEHAMVAQTYAGFLVGHPVRAARYTTPLPGSVDVDWNRPFVEPNPMQDDCVFCVRLTDDEAVRRVAGFQYAIDKEVMGGKSGHLSKWAQERNLDASDPAVRRQFIAAEQYVPRPGGDIGRYGGVRPARPNGWKTKAAPVVSMPLRIKRKMCIDWNHVYTRWMAANDLSYDFDAKTFYREVPEEAYPDDAYGGLGGACNEFVAGGHGTREDFQRIMLHLGGM